MMKPAEWNGSERRASVIGTGSDPMREPGIRVDWTGRGDKRLHTKWPETESKTRCIRWSWSRSSSWSSSSASAVESSSSGGNLCAEASGKPGKLQKETETEAQPRKEKGAARCSHLTHTRTRSPTHLQKGRSPQFLLIKCVITAQK